MSRVFRAVSKAHRDMSNTFRAVSSAAGSPEIGILKRTATDQSVASHFCNVSSAGSCARARACVPARARARVCVCVCVLCEREKSGGEVGVGVEREAGDVCLSQSFFGTRAY